MLTWRSMIGADAEPPSVQLSALVVSGDVLEITKFICICITLTACGLYRNRCTPSATQSQASSSPNATSPPPPSTEPIGEAPPLSSQFPVPCHLVYSSFCVMLFMLIQNSNLDGKLR